MLYVGRTGDNSSPFASPPYQRVGQHLGSHKTQNQLRKHLAKQGFLPEDCSRFKFIAHGPLFEQQTDMEKHRGPRDKVAALEKKLAETLVGVGYKVLNSVKCKAPLDNKMWGRVRAAFAIHFRKLLRPVRHRS
jgi:hypothetical protein